MFDQAYAYQQLARRRNPVRAMVRRFYMANLLGHLQGPTIDIGCGAGQLLECLPGGSIGTEINPFLVEVLRKRGLAVFQSSPNACSLLSEEVKQIARQRGIRCVCLSHVLEHFADAELRLKALAADCEDLNIQTILIVVPGVKGYRSDPTHRTFITLDWLQLRSGDYLRPYRVGRHSYFPFNSRLAGNFFVYNELAVCLYRAHGL